MLEIVPHDEGFAVPWSSEESEQARMLRTELTLAGLPRGREWTTGLVVFRYRNELETLQILTDLLARLGIKFSLDPALESARTAAQTERDLIDRIRKNAGHSLS